MAHDHGSGHHHHQRGGHRHRHRLVAAFALIASVFLVELVVALSTGSLALLSDAGHMATDAAALGIAAAAVHLADRGGTRSGRSFGLYRVEVLAALLNAILLFGVAGWVIWEAVDRLRDGRELDTGPVLIAAFIGLVANVVAFQLLRGGASESVNVEAAYTEVLADLLGSIGVLVGTATIAITGWEWVDPLVGALLGVWILPRTWRLAAKALRILVQAAPRNVDLDQLQADLEEVEGVIDVHDVHVWTLTSEMDVATAHLMVSQGTDHHRVLDEARALLVERYDLYHATLQVEPDDHEGCEDVSW